MPPCELIEHAGRISWKRVALEKEIVLMSHLAAIARVAAFAAALITLSPPPSYAQTASAPAPGVKSAASGTVTPIRAHRETVEARIQDLHQRLGITAAQEPQWQTVAQAMRENAAAVARVAKERHDKQASMTAMDDLRSFEALTAAQADGARKLTAAFEPLYASMSDEQKKDADAIFARRARPHRHRAG
jgi:hypothetical protein